MKRQFELFDCVLAPDIINGRSSYERENVAIIGYPSHRKDGYLYIHIKTGLGIKLPIMNVKVKKLRQSIFDKRGFDLYDKSCEFDCEVKEIHIPRWLLIEAEIEEFII